MPASDAVLGDRDLVRTIMSKAHAASELLSASHSIRNNEECARYFQKWSKTGCPIREDANDEHERTCLDAIGGNDSVFCLGPFYGYIWKNGWKVRLRNASSEEVLENVKQLLHSTPHSGAGEAGTEVYISCTPLTITILRSFPMGTINIDMRSIGERLEGDFAARDVQVSLRTADEILESMLTKSSFDAGSFEDEFKGCPVLRIGRWQPEVIVSRVDLSRDEEEVRMLNAWRG